MKAIFLCSPTKISQYTKLILRMDITPISNKKYYTWMEPSEDSEEPNVFIKSEEEILTEYFPIWSEKMKKVGKESLISKEKCIEDFCTMHWAVQLKSKTKW